MSAIPYSVSRLLMRAVVRVRRGLLMRGIAVVGIVWILGVAAAMLADARWVIFDDRIRWAISLGIVAFTVGAAVAAVVLPLRRRLDFRKIARALDARHPELEERLSTLVELSETDARQAGYSASLFARLGRLAEDDVPKIDLVREFPFRRALRTLVAFAALLLVLVIGVAVSPGLVGRLFVRAVAPWADVGNLRANDVTVRPGDLVALAGSVIRIEAEVDASLHASPTIRISRRRGALWSEETTEPMTDGVYETTADVAEREWRYRVNAGPAVTRYYYVRVSEPPTYDSFTARVDYPDYTRLPPVVYSNDEVSAIRAIEGSRVSFALAVGEPGTVADFRIGGRPVFEHVMQSNRTVNWSLDLVNRDGFRTEKGVHPLTSFRDQPPTIVIERPSTHLPALPPHAKIQVELTASDDVGVRRPELRCGIGDGEMRPVGEIDEFVRAGGNLWRGKTEIDLSRLDLSSATRVRFDFVVRDERPDAYGGAQAATSSVINVSIASHEWGLQVADLREQTQALNAMIDEAKSRLQSAEQLAGQLKNDFRRDGKVPEEVERKNERAAHEASEAEKRLSELQDRLSGDDRFAPLAKALEKTVSDLVAPARNRVENSPFQDRGERAGEMEKAAEGLKAAREKMDELKQRLKERAEKVDTLEKVRDLADRQEALARSARELLSERPKDRNRLEAWRRLEEDAMRRADELANRHPGLDLGEARRKMETAAREIDAMKKDLSEAGDKAGDKARQAQNLRDAASQQNMAVQMQRDAATRREIERTSRRQNNQSAAEARAREAEMFEKRAAAYQKAAEDCLERAEATSAVKALQHQASKAHRDARLTPQSPEKAEAARAVQKAAAEALRREQALRAAIAKGEKTADDLADFERELAQQLHRQAAERAAAARQEAERAIAAARAAADTAENPAADELAERALQARRDAVAAELAERELAGDAPRAEALREAERQLDAVQAAAAEESAREDRILALQRQVTDAFRRNDRGRPFALLPEIARLQSRAAERLASERAESARRAAMTGQDEARATFNRVFGKWNNVRRDEAIAAEEAAIEREQAARTEARGERAKEMLAAAERETGKASTEAGETSDRASQPVAVAAEAAAEAMGREAKSLAAELGVPLKASQAEEQGGQTERGEEASGGGDVLGEVDRLAHDLRRADSPDFFKNLFTRLGWFKINGLSKKGLTDEDLKDVPREYRDLVRRYFLKLSEENKAR